MRRTAHQVHHGTARPSATTKSAQQSKATASSTKTKSATSEAVSECAGGGQLARVPTEQPGRKPPRRRSRRNRAKPPPAAPKTKAPPARLFQNVLEAVSWRAGPSTEAERAPTEQPGRKPRDDEVGATEQSHRQQHQNQKRHQPGCFRMCWRRSAGVPVRAPKRSGLPRNSLAESHATTKSAQQSKATDSSTKTKSATSQAVSEWAGGGQLACRSEHRSGAGSPRNAWPKAPRRRSRRNRAKPPTGSTKTKSATSQAVSECAGGGQLACRSEHRSGAGSHGTAWPKAPRRRSRRNRAKPPPAAPKPKAPPARLFQNVLEAVSWRAGPSHRSGATSSVVSIGAQNRCVRWPSPVHYGTAWSG